MRILQVKALIDGVTNDGKTYRKGDVFPMEASLVEPHVAARQVALKTPPSAGGSEAKPADEA